jgi:hypothetical protein
VARSLIVSQSIVVRVVSALLLAGAGDGMAQGAEMQGDAARGQALFVSKGCPGSLFRGRCPASAPAPDPRRLKGRRLGPRLRGVRGLPSRGAGHGFPWSHGPSQRTVYRGLGNI